MKNLRMICIAVILSLLVIWIPFNSSADKSTIKNWGDFNADYEDSDADGEKDNYISFNTGDLSILVDIITDFTDVPSMPMSMIELRSDTESIMIFGNTIGDDFDIGDTIMIWIEIIQEKESDGDDCEYYEVTKITKTEEVPDDYYNDDDGDDQAVADYGGMFLACGLASIPLIIFISFLAVRWNRDRKQKAEHSIEPITCPICLQNTNYVYEHKRWYCYRCSRYL